MCSNHKCPLDVIPSEHLDALAGVFSNLVILTHVGDSVAWASVAGNSQALGER
jgi:hypothetical protein